MKSDSDRVGKHLLASLLAAGRFFFISTQRSFAPVLILLAVSVPNSLLANDAEKVDKLALECSSGKQKACSELAKMAASNKNPSVRQAAAEKLAKMRQAEADRVKKALATDLVNAAAAGDIATVKSVLSRGVAVDSKNEKGETALVSACQSGHVDIVRLLIAKGAIVNPQGNVVTPLMWASQKGFTEVVRVLLDADADINAKYVDPDYVRMPNGAIAYAGPTTTTSWILSHAPGSTLVHGEENTALSLASKNGHPEVVDLLTKAAAAQAANADADIVISEVQPGVYKMRVQKQTQIGQIGVGPGGATLSMAATHLSKKVAFTGDMTSFVGVATPDRRTRTINVAALTYDPSKQNNPPLAQLGIVELNESGIVKSDNAKTGWINWVATLTFNDAGRTRTIALEDINFWVNRGGENWLSFSVAKAHEVRGDGTAGLDVPVTTKLQQDAGNAIVTLLVEGKYSFHPHIKDSQTLTFVSVPNPPAEGGSGNSASPQKQNGAATTGSLSYSRVALRNGALVLKDVHDSFEGDGWIAGTLVSVNHNTLTVSVSKTVLARDAAAGEKKEYVVTVDEKTSVCVAQKPAPVSSVAVGELKPGQRVSVAFRKGTQTADKVVDQSYEIIGRMATPLTASPTRPSMPQCD